MPRAQLNYLVTTSVGTTIQIANSATVTIRKASDDTLVTLYEGALGSDEVANPLTVDASGRVSAWVEIDKYLLVIEGNSFTAYSEYWEAVPADHLATYGKGFVLHGTDAGVERPAGFVSVEWTGSVVPVNAVSQDTWINTAYFGKGVVIHGDDPDVARPASFVSIEWIGSVEPVNATDYDTWVPIPEIGLDA